MAAWPAADRTEVVVAASQVRIATVALPPMPESRVASAAAFALEDQLAGPNAAHHVAVSPRSRDGNVRVAIVARALIDGIVARCPNVARIVAECDLAVPAGDWRWCAAELQGAGFVRRRDGSAFPTDPPSADGTLPAELELALQQVRRSDAPPARIRVEVPIAPSSAPSLFARWTRETGAEFVGGAPLGVGAGGPICVHRCDRPPPGSKRGRPRQRHDSSQDACSHPHWRWPQSRWSSTSSRAQSNGDRFAGRRGAMGASGCRSRRLPACRPILPRRPRPRGLARPALRANASHPGTLCPGRCVAAAAKAAPALATLRRARSSGRLMRMGTGTLDLALTNPAAIGDLELRMRNAGVPRWWLHPRTACACG
jgi:hypothetical protein